MECPSTCEFWEADGIRAGPHSHPHALVEGLEKDQSCVVRARRASDAVDVFW